VSLILYNLAPFDEAHIYNGEISLRSELRGHTCLSRYLALQRVRRVFFSLFKIPLYQFSIFPPPLTFLVDLVLAILVEAIVVVKFLVNVLQITPLIVDLL